MPDIEILQFVPTWIWVVLGLSVAVYVALVVYLDRG